MKTLLIAAVALIALSAAAHAAEPDVSPRAKGCLIEWQGRGPCLPSKYLKEAKLLYELNAICRLEEPTAEARNMLRQVQSDRSNLAHGWLPFAADSITAVWHSDAARGPSTHHSITSSAATSNLSGTVRPSALAVLRLMTNSNLVGLITGRSAGFSPLRMRPV